MSVARSFGQNQDGSMAAVGGLFGGVEPSVAYIAITDGSYLELTPPQEDESGVEMWSTQLRFFGYIQPYYVQDFRTNVYNALQYSVHGHLAGG